MTCTAMNTDGRALDHATLTELRKRGVAAVQSGESPPLVAAALGVNVRTCFAGCRCIDGAVGISWMRASVAAVHRSSMA